METKAIVRGVRLSSDIGRLVADMIRGKRVDLALNILTFSPQKAAGIIKKCLDSAIANAEHNEVLILTSSKSRRSMSSKVQRSSVSPLVQKVAATVLANPPATFM